MIGELLPAATPATPDIICWLAAAVPPRQDGRVDTRRAAGVLGVSSRTVRRWVQEAGEREFNAAALTILRRSAILRGHGDYLWPGLDPTSVQRQRLRWKSARDACAAGRGVPVGKVTQVYLYHHPQGRVFGVAHGSTRATSARLRRDGAKIIQVVDVPDPCTAQVLKYAALDLAGPWTCITPRSFLTAGRTETWQQRGGVLDLHDVLPR